MTRYLRVRETLVREIAEGRYPVGRRFPTDHELCARFEVSRATVREALRDLQQDGVIARRRGAGTVVAAQAPAPYVHTLASLNELDDYAADTCFECMAEGVVVAREALASRLSCAVGTRWLRFAGLRFGRQDNNPLCWTEVLLSDDLIGDREAIRAEKGPYFDRVRRIRGFTADVVEQQVVGYAITKDHAELLDCPEGAPALLVRRRYIHEDGSPFEISVSIHPVDRYVLEMRLKRQRSSQSLGLARDTE